jgi:hypothetical protein
VAGVIERQAKGDSVWRRRTVLGVLGAWALVSVAGLSKLVAPADAPPGRQAESLLDFLRANIPTEDGYLFVDPGAFGTDTGIGIRLRYELYPRRYDDVRASEGEATIRQLMRDEGLRFVVVPDASQYAPADWLRQPRAWLRRIDFDTNRYLLEMVA